MPSPAEIQAKALLTSRAGSKASKTRAARQLRSEEVERLIASYRVTGSVAATAREFGLARQTVGQHLARAGISTIIQMSDMQRGQAIRRYGEGASASAVGRELGFSTHVVLRVLRNHEVEIRR